MTDPHDNRPHIPMLLVDPAAIACRIEELDKTAMCRECRDAVIPVTTDTVRLLIEVIRLRELLIGKRAESANRLAAMKAALGAAADNESDPLQFLRDEIDTAPGNDEDAGWCR
jgi:hypothetical protein